ncbi:MAG: SEL1-like repeat protein [Alphaproteobacteria bacterium]|nr:SEL1-like repeat protein [Alphaproteobacteria bacterium]MBL6938368.1 SEL1-like repeat protein [Alphaproteobacteria bacterium]MBL7096427.1 SEL1-like repeat protein [Alphaproteobacteria bacterium]
MTRKILRSFSEAPDDMTPAREQWTSNGGYNPQPEPRPLSRRDTDDMLAHVARSESESGDIYRRIEEQLRNVARRLESTERNQSENNRAMSKAASEINVAAREQAQAFDQLGGSVMSLADRLERLERNAAGDGTRDAIKGLHQGLSRLADQITTTANHSASQIATLANSLEALAGRLAQARQEAEHTSHQLEQRISQLDARVAQVSHIDRQINQIDNQVAQIDQRLSHVSALDDRLRSVERGMQSNSDAVSHALESIEARKDEEANQLRRDAETAGAIARLEDNFSRLEMRGPDPALDRRLSGIERSLSDIVTRFDAPTHNDAVEDNIKRLAQRIEAAEARQREQVAELRAAMNDAARHVAAADALSHPVTGAQATPFPPVASFDAPPFAEINTPPSAELHGFQAGADPFAAAPAYTAAAAPFAAAEPAFGGAAFGADPFAAEPPPPAPPAAGPDSYLSAARRSARAAAAQAEAERGSRMGGFSWGAAAATETAAADAKSGSKKTYIWIAVVAGLSIVALAGGAILSQSISGNSTHTIQRSSDGPLFEKSQPSVTGPVATRPAADLLPPENGASVTIPVQTPPLRGAKPAAPKPLPTQAVAPTPVRPVPVAPATPPAMPPQQAALTPLDKLTQMANAGNAKAELVVGLKYLDGDGVTASDSDAAKWLERAAEQGMAVAQYRLGTMYERGRGVPSDAAKAVKWYQLAAQAGNRKAMHNLAVAYASGAGVPKNLPEAARWFSKAAALGLADSEFNLAVLYERGLGVPQSLLDAYKWYAIAAAGGDTESKNRIGALATQLSADDRAAAQHAADAFRPGALDPRANVAPSLNEIAG